MLTKSIIIFPYGGYMRDDRRSKMFWEILGICQQLQTDPVIVLNRDTERRQQASTFLADHRFPQLEVVRVWSVDTCQMWLHGWGYVMDKYKDKVSRIVLLPGDVEIVEKLDVFRAILSSFIDAARPEIIIGDFTTPDRYSSKELVDTYGTYSLLANWFPEVSRAVKALPLSKPRSEFLNIEVSVLDQFLDKRKFAYEQTLNMLIRSWDYENKRWRHGIRPFPLGTLQDDKSFRQYRDCLDQIERTERLLKLLWRELNEPPSTGVFEQDELRYKEFSQEYEDIARRSTDIRESARLTIRALLGA